MRLISEIHLYLVIRHLYNNLAESTKSFIVRLNSTSTKSNLYSVVKLCSRGRSFKVRQGMIDFIWTKVPSLVAVGYFGFN